MGAHLKGTGRFGDARDRQKGGNRCRNGEQDEGQDGGGRLPAARRLRGRVRFEEGGEVQGGGRGSQNIKRNHLPAITFEGEVREGEQQGQRREELDDGGTGAARDQRPQDVNREQDGDENFECAHGGLVVGKC